MSRSYPIIFSFNEIVPGNRFLADVRITGQALLTYEDDKEVWVYGVQPASVAGGGFNKDEAFMEFQKHYRSIVCDIAQESTTYEEFSSQMTSLFNAISEPSKVVWMDALQEVRSGDLTLDIITKKAELNPPRLEVKQLPLQQLRPVDTCPNESFAKAA